MREDMEGSDSVLMEPLPPPPCVCCSVDGSGTTLQAARSRVRFLIVKVKSLCLTL
jgi:hypothetical protein